MGCFLRVHTPSLRTLIVSALLLNCVSALAQDLLFSVPAQAMDQALKEWSRQSGVQIFAARKLIQNSLSKALQGRFSTQDSLHILLEESNLGFKELRKNVYVVIEREENLPISIHAKDDSFGLEEIVVTSRRRRENIQDSPIAVSAFTDIKLEQLGLQELLDIEQSVPNLIFVPSPPISGNSAATAVFLRGVGQLDFTINVDPGVGTYVDGVYLGRSVGSVIDLLDLERVEVLRGPQGTLFGRNTIGGAVRLMSKKPDAEASSELSLTLGTDHQTDLQATLNLPINETLLTKTSLLRRKRDGYVIDGNGSDLGNDNSTSVRSQWLWLTDNGIEARLILDWTKDRENGAANTALNLFSRGEIPDRVNFGNEGEAASKGCDIDKLNTSQQCFGPAWLQSSQEKTASGFSAKSDNDIYGSSLTLSTDWSWASLTSVTAWRQLKSDFQRDSDHTPFNVFATANRQRQHQFSQEFQALGDSLNNTLHWIAGLYYFEEKAEELTQVFMPDIEGRPIQGNFEHEASNKNWASYGEVTVDFGERTHLTIGGRYTHERKHYASDQVMIDPNLSNAIIETLIDEPGQSLHFKKFTSRATLAFDWNTDTQTYLTYAQGFKSGGFNSRHLRPSADLRAIAYQPEYVAQTEIGLKHTNPNNTLRLNTAFFYSDYDDIQISTNPNSTQTATITQNAAKASISGLELEFALAPSAQWLIEANAGYLDARYDKLDDQVTINPNNDFAWTPKWSGSVSVSFNHRLKDHSTLFTRIGARYKSETEGTAENEIDVRQDSYTTADFQVSYHNEIDNWNATINIDNLTDRQYLISANQNQAIGYAEGVYDRGRRWRFSLSKKF